VGGQSWVCEEELEVELVLIGIARREIGGGRELGEREVVNRSREQTFTRMASAEAMGARLLGEVEAETLESVCVLYLLNEPIFFQSHPKPAPSSSS
jgi:hypothetical protein